MKDLGINLTNVWKICDIQIYTDLQWRCKLDLWGTNLNIARMLVLSKQIYNICIPIKFQQDK